MREGWKIQSLGDVCHVIGGGTPSKRIPSYYDGDIPWATVRDMRNELLSRTEFCISEQAVKSSSTNIIPQNNVVIATRVGLGKVCLLQQDTAINQDLRGIVPISGNLDVQFLFRWLQSVAGLIENEGTGATVKGVRLPFIKSLRVPIPSLSEQKHIVAILDEAFAGIDTAIGNTERNLANARELFDSYLNSAFDRRGWVGRSVKDVCETIIDCVNKTAPVVDKATPFKMIRTTNVRDGRINLASVKYVSEETFSIWTRRQRPRRGDVILTREAPMGEVGIIDTDDEIFLGQRLVSYRANPTKLHSRFLLYAFQSSFVQRQIRAMASGSTVQHMRVPDSQKLVIPLPDVAEQESAVSELDFLRVEVSSLESIYEQKFTSLAELKQSLLQKAFSGELTSKSVEDATEAAA